MKTGQEKSISEFDTHISWTIEMWNLSEKYDVAVIDEIQMISDPERGYAWTNAFLGIQAKEIHLWGDQRSLELITKMWLVTQDKLKIKQYKRMSSLKVEQKPIRSFKELQPGDWIVAFSRRVLFQLK